MPHLPAQRGGTRFGVLCTGGYRALPKSAQSCPLWCGGGCPDPQRSGLDDQRADGLVKGGRDYPSRQVMPLFPACPDTFCRRSREACGMLAAILQSIHSTPWHLWMPNVVLLAVPLVCTAVVTVLGVQQRSRSPYGCKTCGYDLRASPTCCPECGEALPYASESRKVLSEAA